MSAEGFRARARPEPPSAQILVVVANTLERSWRTDAEKGFLSTAVAQVLVDPKPRAKALQRGPHESTPPRSRRGRTLPPPIPDNPVRGAGDTNGREPPAVRTPSPPTLLPTPLRRGAPAPATASRRRRTPYTKLGSPRTFPERPFPPRGSGPGADALGPSRRRKKPFDAGRRHEKPRRFSRRPGDHRCCAGRGTTRESVERPTAVHQTAARSNPPRAPSLDSSLFAGRGNRVTGGSGGGPRREDPSGGSNIVPTVRHGEREPGQDSGTRRVGNVHLPGPYDSSERSDNQPGEAGGGPVESCLFC